MSHKSVKNIVIISIALLVVLIAVGIILANRDGNSDRKNKVYRNNADEQSVNEGMTPTPTDTRLIYAPERNPFIYSPTPSPIPTPESSQWELPPFIATPTPLSYPTPTKGMELGTGKYWDFDPTGTMYTGSDGLPKFWTYETVTEGKKNGYDTRTTELRIFDEACYQTFTETEFFDKDGNSIGFERSIVDNWGCILYTETLEDGVVSYFGGEKDKLIKGCVKAFYSGELDEIMLANSKISFAPEYSDSSKRFFCVQLEFSDMTLDESNPRFELFFGVTFEDGSRIKLFNKLETFPESMFADIKEQIKGK